MILGKNFTFVLHNILANLQLLNFIPSKLYKQQRLTLKKKLLNTEACVANEIKSSATTQKSKLGTIVLTSCCLKNAAIF